MLTTIRRRAFSYSLLVIGSLAFTGCLDGTGPEEEEEPDIGGVRITAVAGGTASGETTVTTSGQTGTTGLTLRANTANALTVHVLGVTGQDEPIVVSNAADFEIRFRQSGTLLTSTTGTTYPYSVTVTPTATGSVTLEIEVYHKEEGHVEFTRPILVTVSSAS
jgi:hypothetical protein